MHSSRLWFAGLGCRRGCSSAELIILLRASCHEAGIEPSGLCGLATLDRRAREPALVELAQGLGLSLQAWSAGSLAVFDDRLSHRSARVQALYGIGGIAETTALAAAADHRIQAGQPTYLVVPRRASAAATVAIAVREATTDTTFETQRGDTSR
ncbi:cobalamin biosynthesis protein [Salinisphaera sp. SPP-AMP-43]|uniref:cobalamin biosynthesis protein n=1 Tax=Salinisphaera sp. SPP-AMP-43 TaxID=3121288 RepID=UPI003C6E9560